MHEVHASQGSSPWSATRRSFSIRVALQLTRPVGSSSCSARDRPSRPGRPMPSSPVSSGCRSEPHDSADLASRNCSPRSHQASGAFIFPQWTETRILVRRKVQPRDGGGSILEKCLLERACGFDPHTFRRARILEGDQGQSPGPVASRCAPQGVGINTSSFRHASLAQLVEQRTLTPWVLGSSPRGCTCSTARGASSIWQSACLPNRRLRVRTPRAARTTDPRIIGYHRFDSRTGQAHTLPVFPALEGGPMSSPRLSSHVVVAQSGRAPRCQRGGCGFGPRSPHTTPS
jgi:hypothetical protein